MAKKKQDNSFKFCDIKPIMQARARELEFRKYIKKFKNKTIVIKYGGAALETSKNISYLIDDIIFLKQQYINVIVLHGGSKQLNSLLEKNKIDYTIIDGIRVTSEEILKYAVIAFKKVNKHIVSNINKKGKGLIKALGLNGNEIPITISDFLDKKKFQYVGKIKKINIEYIKALRPEYIPVLSSLSQTKDNIPLNINADINASQIAKKLKAEKLIIMTDTDGVLDENKQLISTINYRQAIKLIKNKIIQKGMVAKINACLDTLSAGVKKVHIINGTVPNALVKEIFTDEGIGTQIIK